MKKSDNKLKIVIGILVGIIILQWFIFTTRKKPSKVILVRPVAQFQGKIAIVLDDWGYNLNNVASASRIKYPLTMSVLPNLPYSRQAATILHKDGFQIILHLPMEPKAKEEAKLEKNTIKVASTSQERRDILIEDLRNVPFVLGVSNHMGSKATGDEKTMQDILKELKKKKLFFLDSFTGESVAGRLAENFGVKFAKRDVFIDNKKDSKYIRAQLNKLKAEARRKGFAVGIGHDRSLTLEVLNEALPEFENEGFKIVFVSELVR